MNAFARLLLIDPKVENDMPETDRFGGVVTERDGVAPSREVAA